MRTFRPSLPRWLGPAALILVIAGLALEGSLRSARPDGQFQRAAKDAVLAARLAPGDAARAQEADQALDRALLARFLPAARVGLFLGIGTLVILGARRRHRRQRARQMTAWLDQVDARLDVGPSGPPRRLDLFLRSPGGGMPVPRPGPTLSLVFSHAGSSASVRLRPQPDLHDNAVRTRIRPETLAKLASRPGRWRVQALLDGRVVAVTNLEIPARRAGGRPVLRSAS